MPTMQISWQLILIALVVVLISALVAFIVWCVRSPMTIDERKAFLRGIGSDLVRLPGRLRRLAADPRTPRRARWMLIALAVYVASPIDPIPDFIPVIGHLDEIVIVPIVLARVRRMIPPEVWETHFPPR
jgi:hypothetical protein